MYTKDWDYEYPSKKTLAMIHGTRPMSAESCSYYGTKHINVNNEQHDNIIKRILCASGLYLGVQLPWAVNIYTDLLFSNCFF